MTLTRDQFINVVEDALFNANFNVQSHLVGLHLNNKTKMNNFLTIYLRIQNRVNYYLAQWDAATTDPARDAVLASVVTTLGTEVVDPDAAVLWPDSGGRFGDTRGPSSSIVNNLTSYNSTTGKVVKDSGITLQTRSQSSSTRTLNSIFQVNTTRDSLVNYSIDIATSITLTTGQSGTAILEIASNSAFTTNVQTISQFTNSNTGTLTIGLALSQIGTARLSGFVPAGYYVKLRTVNNTGTPTFTFRSGQEVLL